MKLGQQGKDLIQSYEKLELEAYMPTPNDVPTIGWGHTKGVKIGDTCTPEQADAYFYEDIAWVEDCINKHVTAVLTQAEFDALASLCFNIGCSQFSGSTLLRKLNANDYDGAAAEFKRWNRQNGQVLNGLTKRRAEEEALFESA